LPFVKGSSPSRVFPLLYDPLASDSLSSSAEYRYRYLQSRKGYASAVRLTSVCEWQFSRQGRQAGEFPNPLSGIVCWAGRPRG